MATAAPEILKRLEDYDIRPNERLGQHMLIDPEWLGFIANQTFTDAHVIEIGAGPGNLTELIAPLAGAVTAVEIDKRFEPMLEEVQQKFSNVTIVYGDALKLNYWNLQKQSERTLQVIANIPYHISEPLMKILTELPIEEAVITVGDKLGVSLTETNTSSIDFTKLSLMALGFFDIGFLGEIPKKAFYPPPRTESHIVRLTPKSKEEASAPGIRIIQQLFKNADSGSVESIIRATVQGGTSDTTMRDKAERNKHDRREMRRELTAIRIGYNTSGDLYTHDHHGGMKDPISRLQISQGILQNRFSKLNNEELRTLARAILEIYPLS